MLRWRDSALLVNITVTLMLGRVFCVCRCSSFWTGSQNFASAVFAVTLLMSHLLHLFSFWRIFCLSWLLESGGSFWRAPGVSGDNCFSCRDLFSGVQSDCLPHFGDFSSLT